ncbi:hypothetical protein PC111_g8279 [Phytophthora cactorum]|nr:hypothetical protein PC111_g8279 [Phytophthora cactorum]KAG2831184.1 hypothetical protein PC112_g7393 [Phytophthora cactorum]
MAFLRQMQPEDTKTRGMFANSGSHMLEKPLEINVPTNTLAYAVAFRDPNPIHRSNDKLFMKLATSASIMARRFCLWTLRTAPEKLW